MMSTSYEMLQGTFAEHLLHARHWTGLRGTCDGQDQTLLLVILPLGGKTRELGPVDATLHRESFSTGRKMAGLT